MKTISSALQAHIAGDVTTIATCWKLTLTDSTVLGFTDHDQNIVYSGVTYLAATGFSPTAIASNSDLSVDNLDVEGIIDSIVIKEDDILSGRYDYAEMEVFIVNYADLTMGDMQLKRGFLGEVSFNKNQFTAEVRALQQRLSNIMGALYSGACRAQLGDANCTINMTPFTKTGTVTAVTNNSVFSDSSRTEASGYFSGGVITFTSGLNNGRNMDVMSFTGTQITLALPAYYQVQVGDNYTMQAGCDKTFTTCCTRFSNSLNFRGEPFIPGTDAILATSTTTPLA